VLLLGPALPGLGNRVGFPDLLIWILQGGGCGGSLSRRRWRRKRINAGKGHIGGIEEVKSLRGVWIHRHHQAD